MTFRFHEKLWRRLLKTQERVHLLDEQFKSREKCTLFRIVMLSVCSLTFHVNFCFFLIVFYVKFINNLFSFYNLFDY